MNLNNPFMAHHVKPLFCEEKHIIFTHSEKTLVAFQCKIPLVVLFWVELQLFSLYNTIICKLLEWYEHWSKGSHYPSYMYPNRGRHSAVGIVTLYGLEGLGIESRWGEIFRTRPDQPWGPPSLLYNGYRVFPGGKVAGACIEHPPQLVPRLKKEYTYTSTPRLGLCGLF